MKTIEIRRNGETLVHALHANNFFTRLRGLHGRELYDGDGLILTPCNSIHTFGMAYDIDAVYLDKTGTVLRVDAELPSGRTWPAQRGARSVLELPAGYADKTNIQTGDRLEVLT
jgi:uncharacterized membrane protein (UPF0127 family)